MDIGSPSLLFDENATRALVELMSSYRTGDVFDINRIEELLSLGADPRVQVERVGGYVCDIPHMLVDVAYSSDKNFPVLLRLLELFLKNPQIDVNSLDSIGRTIIHIAFSDYNTSFLRVILKCPRINVNIADPHHGDTVLHRACSQLNVEKVALLLSESHADPNILNRDGKTPLYIVIGKPQYLHDTLQITELLLENGGNPNLRYSYGETLLHLCNYPEMCKLLLSHGADPFIKCNGERRNRIERRRFIFSGVSVPKNPMEQAHAEKNYAIRDIMVQDAMRKRDLAIDYELRKKSIPLDVVKMIKEHSHTPFY